MTRTPYLQVDLDAITRSGEVHRASGLTPEAALAGLVWMWADAFRRKTSTVTSAQLRGYFGATSDTAVVADALVASGFLEPLQDKTWRVRGTSRYLAISEARSRGGHAAKSNLVPGARYRLKPRDSRETAESSSGLSIGSRSDDPMIHDPRSEDLAAGAAVPVESPEAPPTPAKKPRQRAQAPPRATNGAPPLVLEPQTPHEPDRARQELIAAICADFAATHDGAKYKPNEKLDFKALDRMRKSHTDAEILTHCRNGFRSKYGGASYIWEVEQKWNKFSTPEQTTKTAQERAAESRDTSRDWGTWDGKF